jgi:rhodanese-related sulfurtransferase
MVLQVSVTQAWKILQENPQSILVDVRTKEEVDFVGFVDLSSIDDKIIFMPWRTYPNMSIDESFTDKLLTLITKATPEFESNKIDLLFLCRSGSRSFEAAMSMSNFGYNCHNIIAGFEGHINSSGHRRSTDGWVASNLPWKQH